MTSRTDGRSADALRPVTIETGVQRNPEGSVLYACGGTRVLIAASIDEGVAGWLRGSGKGWVTAEYAMHPRANPQRQDRDGRKGRIDGRTQEIQRLIGRSLRAAVNLEKLGERTITVDCDVLDADGGTRTASITGGFVALALALDRLRSKGVIGAGVLRGPVAAISAGIVGPSALLDLAYVEDSKADVDLNVVAMGDGGIVEVQGTAEGAPVPRDRWTALVDLAMSSMPSLFASQSEALARAGTSLDKLVR
ncbi:ribonuclease PH [Sandaracinus amylolyticus]|uniref:ribonuclease PH n=1 Tax=Sandaracinus amylolyticus TaxID=927083 RepID=UPI00069DA898|nr:ribonuclease PH [Sandaracinus amylolyticus]